MLLWSHLLLHSAWSSCSPLCSLHSAATIHRVSLPTTFRNVLQLCVPPDTTLRVHWSCNYRAGTRYHCALTVLAVSVHWKQRWYHVRIFSAQKYVTCMHFSAYMQRPMLGKCMSLHMVWTGPKYTMQIKSAPFSLNSYLYMLWTRPNCSRPPQYLAILFKFSKASFTAYVQKCWEWEGFY